MKLNDYQQQALTTAIYRKQIMERYRLEQAKNALQHAHRVSNVYHAEAQENGGVGSSFDSEQTEGFFDILREAMFELDSALMYAE